MTAPEGSRGPRAPGDGTFRAASRVRFDEAGADGLVRASTLLRLAQDLAWQHGSAIGLTRAWYEEHGLAWLVRAVDLEVDLPIAAGERLDATTSIIGHRPAWARRRVDLWLAAGAPDHEQAIRGRPAAVATTDWVLVDRRGRLIRIPEAFGDRFSAPAAEMEPNRVRLGPAPDPAHLTMTRVRPHEVDPNGHLNNAALIDWLDEALLEAGGRTEPMAVPRRYRVEYLAPLLPGASATIAAWREGSSWALEVRTVDAAPAARAVIRAGAAGRPTSHA